MTGSRIREGDRDSSGCGRTHYTFVSLYEGGQIKETFTRNDFITHPRQFKTYRWWKPILVAVLYAVLLIIFMFSVDLITKLVLQANVTSTGYDDMDFFTTAGAFSNGATAAVAIPAMLIAAKIVKDRPISSYFSSMGEWRWKVFFKTLAAGFVVFGIPTIIALAMRPNTGMKFTLGGIILMAIFIPLQGISEELTYRAFLMQTVGSWFKAAVVGLLAQIVVFSLVHPYNFIGVVEIAVPALIYGMVAVRTKGIEASSALHILNNCIEIFMVCFGFGLITSEQTVGGVLFKLAFKALYLIVIFYAAKKLHWFNDMKKDDVAEWNAKYSK